MTLIPIRMENVQCYSMAKGDNFLQATKKKFFLLNYRFAVSPGAKHDGDGGNDDDQNVSLNVFQS